MEPKPYIVEYNIFMQKYNKGVTDGGDVGEVIAKMAQYFCDANLAFADTSILFGKKASEIETRIDDNGKEISSSKAKVLSAATKESDDLIKAKADVENIQQIINALKSLQKGIMNEYSNIGMN